MTEKLSLNSYVFTTVSRNDQNIILHIDKQVITRMKEYFENKDEEKKVFKEFYKQAKKDLEKTEKEEKNFYPSVYYIVY